jgi:hypothetical protein
MQKDTYFPIEWVHSLSDCPSAKCASYLLCFDVQLHSYIITYPVHAEGVDVFS